MRLTKAEKPISEPKIDARKKLSVNI